MHLPRSLVCTGATWAVWEQQAHLGVSGRLSLHPKPGLSWTVAELAGYERHKQALRSLPLSQGNTPKSGAEEELKETVQKVFGQLWSCPEDVADSPEPWVRRTPQSRGRLPLSLPLL